MNVRFLVFCISVWYCIVPKEKDFLDYHKQFIQVENLVVNEKFKEAELLLNQLLVDFEPSFAKDYVIAAEICLLNNNNEKAIDWIRESIKRGVKIDCLKAIRVFEEKITISNWQKLENDFQKLRTQYYSSINIAASKTFHRNYQKEQLKKTSREYKGIVYSNFYRIKEFVDKETYPGENIIGIDNSTDASKINDCSFDNSKVTVTLLHVDFPIYKLTEDKLVKSIRNGSLHPREFATIYTFESNRVSRLYKTSSSKSKNSSYNFQFPFEKRKGKLTQINNDREKFGICSVETDKMKSEIEEKYGIKLKFGYK